MKINAPRLPKEQACFSISSTAECGLHMKHLGKGTLSNDTGPLKHPLHVHLSVHPTASRSVSFGRSGEFGEFAAIKPTEVTFG
jgi:hypothetical protein